MSGKCHLNEGDYAEAECLRREIGVIAGYDLLILQSHPSPRALRGRQAHAVSELLIGQPAILLQRCQHFQVKRIHLDHARNAPEMHGSCMIMTFCNPDCTHLARPGPQTANIQGMSAADQGEYDGSVSA